MEASRLTIEPEKLRFEKLSPSKRAKLRQQNIIDFIRSKPAGTPIALSEFAAVAGYSISGVQSVWSLMNTMIKQGMITKVDSEHGGRANTRAYYVNDATITRSADKPIPPEPEAETSVATLEDYAREFAWRNNSDSLREFVKYMNGVKLDVQRLLGGGDATSSPVKNVK